MYKVFLKEKDLNLVSDYEIKRLLKENIKLKKYYINALADYEIEKSKNTRAIELISNWSQEYNGLMKTNNIYIPEDKQDLFDLRKILGDEENDN